MVSMDGLLDAHEVSVRARVEALREQAARVAGELSEAELALEHVAITRATLAAALAGHGGHGAVGRDDDLAVRDACGPATVPVRRAGLTEVHLPVGYRDLVRLIADAPGPVRAKDLAFGLGLEVTVAKVEGLRSKLKRLVERGWIAEPAPGAFVPASTGSASPGGGS